MSNNTFEQFKFTRQFLNAIEDAGFVEPTPIQKKAIPAVKSGENVIGIAPTGTGKTAAYLLPMLTQIKYAQGEQPRALVLAPTRELCMQIEERAKMLSKYTNIRTAALYGGVGKKKQIEEWEANKGADIVVATPGRLMDMYKLQYLEFKKIKWVVIDEADRMMDMGFMPQIRKIQEVLPNKRQNLLFSATYPPKVEKMANEFIDYAIRIEVEPQATTVETVTLKVYETPNFKTKLNFLLWMLEDEERYNRVMIFVRTKQAATNITKFLERKTEERIRVIHANKDQNARINAMNEFKEGGLRVLVATDVASRGIDVSMVSHVINFDVPVVYEDFVHRVGRTGRAQNEGTAITFMNPAEKYHVRNIQRLIKQQIPVFTLPHDLTIEETPKEEAQEMAREIDHQKRKENPNFKGAFHEKKWVLQGKGKRKDNRRGKGGAKGKVGNNSNAKNSKQNKSGNKRKGKKWA